ncbi:hypothetical protein C9374_001736 [Naegleria lovaniensis]|uniref:Uncharacterized protein n=1 Tax=Naegleria lovaniensis TaxID=51637 RepID=A0AA88GWI3_NAELO|nr:uncharacterized protein C9374_001736 [Naegleria lovaniensis]KAG2387404.1 hypothetical protein C9374_001736 [Naegleria lovaniensis]
MLSLFSTIKIDKKGHCSLAHQNLKEIPYNLFSKKQLSKVLELDLSHNEIEFQGLQHLYQFENLKSLVLDHNLIKSDVNLNMGKPLPSLELLWVNSCNITNLSTFIEKVKSMAPNLQYFSMLKNKACPNFFVEGGSPDAYNDYRLFVISRLPNLKVLDTTPVTEEERQKAMKMYASLKMQPPSNVMK